MAGRLSPIFTDKTALWPSASSSGSSSSISSDSEVEEDMEIDYEQMTISQQCHRFEREMIWSPIESTSAPSSLGNCDMLTQQTNSQLSAIVIESDDNNLAVKRPIVLRECLMSPDMFADSQELVEIRKHMEWRPNVASSETLLCGQKMVNDASMMELMEFTEQGDIVKMQTGESIAAIAANINLLSSDESDAEIRKIPMNRILIETEDEIVPLCNVNIKSDDKMELILQSDTLVHCKSHEDPKILLPCNEYEVQPTPEELTVFRKRLLQSNLPLNCGRNLSPIVRQRKILKAKNGSKIITPHLSRIVENGPSNIKMGNQIATDPKSSIPIHNIVQSGAVQNVFETSNDFRNKLKLVENDDNTFSRILEKSTDCNIYKDSLDIIPILPSTIKSVSTIPTIATYTTIQKNLIIPTIHEIRTMPTSPTKLNCCTVPNIPSRKVKNETSNLQQTNTKSSTPVRNIQARSILIKVLPQNGPKSVSGFSNVLNNKLQLVQNDDSTFCSILKQSTNNKNKCKNPIDLIPMIPSSNEISSTIPTISNIPPIIKNRVIPTILEIPTMPTVPNIPTIPSIPTIPAVPNIPSIPTISNNSSNPTIPTLRTIPNIPIIPTISSFSTIPTIYPIPHVPSLPIIQKVQTNSSQCLYRSTSIAASSDRTYCSFAERQNTQKQQLDSEPFDIDEAIQNLMHVCEVPSLNDSGPATTPGGTLSERNDFADEFIGDYCVTVLSQRSTYLSSIEKIVLRFLLDLVDCDDDGRVTLTVQRTNWESCIFEPLSQTLNFSQQNAQYFKVASRHKIMLILDMLKEIYFRLKFRQRCTQRELYYNDPGLYQDMRRVSSALQIVSSMIGAMPWELGVFSTSCGLMAGPIAVKLANDEVIDCTDMSGGMIIPHLTTGIKSIETTAELVLIVEKDTVFQRLLTADLHKHIGKHCILVTGKGYPQINTRVMLHKIWSHCRLPIFILCDADPHGIEIMLIYRHGSMQMSRCVDHLAVPDIQWIGLRPSDISRLGLQTLPLTVRDERLIRNMLQRPYISETVCSELQVLLRIERKAEIESLSISSPAYLVETFLPQQLIRQNVEPS